MADNKKLPSPPLTSDELVSSSGEVGSSLQHPNARAGRGEQIEGRPTLDQIEGSNLDDLEAVPSEVKGSRWQKQLAKNERPNKEDRPIMDKWR